MVDNRRSRGRVLGVLAAVAATAAGGVPAAADVDGRDWDEVRMQRAQVASAPLQFGSEPLAQVRAAAEDAAAEASCGLDASEVTDLTLAPTWPEVSGDGEAPSPMTLSRYDDQSSLLDPQQRAEGLFFNPGVGIWQLDSAGMGAQDTAASAVDTGSAAQRVAPQIVQRYCSAVAGGSAEQQARAAAWQPWHACDEGACEDIYQRLTSEGVTEDPNVTRYGGAEQRTCSYEGAEYDCLYIDPDAAQGENSWSEPGFGPAPVPAPFYSFEHTEGGTTYEVRYWAAEDSGASTDVSALRPLGTDARGGLTWSSGSGMCDTTAGRGAC
ncbi:hypothetical protein IQ251_17575 [Saccharopolyspora sp. HNM0983]|uniref:Uncharacterized protein n=1 Tax=Saccharopolyspora montiporae TaxID=2781240 RepID=A0A929BES8_9PSEU|nr:hypothetical protein [Saccharopolyspora sp. HNM0983]MBE9376263.1 hypothetical protein [Saccharopolyspora sp. HNM0983]